VASEVILPKLGMNMESAKIVRWLKHEGDQVAVGDVLAEVETDKTTTDLESEAAGVLRRLLVEEGQTVAVSQTLAVIASADEDITALVDLAARRPDDHAHVTRVYDSWRPAPAPAPVPALASGAAAATNGTDVHEPLGGASGAHGAHARPAASAAVVPSPAVNGPAGATARSDAAAPAWPRGVSPDVAGIRARMGLRSAGTEGAAATRTIVPGPATAATAPRLPASAASAASAASTASAVPPQRPERLVIYGAGLGAKQLLEITRQLDGVVVLGLIDDNADLSGAEIAGLPVLGGQAALAALVQSGQIDGVALSFHSDVRRKIHRRLRDELGVRLAPLVDPRAIVGHGVQVGEGALIEAGAIVGPGTIVGDGAIVDVGAVVAHDCSLGAFSHLSPGCRLSGVVSLAENVLVGVGASINSTVSVGRNVIIAPGAAVMNDVPDAVVVSGVPAKVIGQSRRGA
jgi:sugar O-acyltransferase (sialic acid O-acetyltransferase NeuD family)